MKIDNTKYKTLPIDSIIIPTQKCKLDDAVMYEHLKNSILLYGQTSTVHIRKNEEEKNEVFLGRNIIRVLTDLRIETIIVYDHGSIALPEAKLAALRMDLIQFPWDDVALSSLLYELSQQYPIDVLYDKIPLDKRKINALIQMKTYDWEKESEEEKKKREIRAEKKRQKMLMQQQEKQRRAGIHLYERIGLNLFQ